jgi:hypothetical protein
MKEIKYTILYCVFVRTFVLPFYYGSGNVINYGSGSDFMTSYGSGSTRQKVTVPTVLVHNTDSNTDLMHDRYRIEMKNLKIETNVILYLSVRSCKSRTSTCRLMTTRSITILYKITTENITGAGTEYG